MANPESKRTLIDEAKTARLSKKEFEGDGNNTIEQRVDNQNGAQILGTVTDIKELNQMKANPQFLSLIAEQVVDSVMVTNLNYEVIWINRAFQKLYGYSLQEVLGRSPDFLNAEPNSKEIQNDIYETISLGQGWRGEVLNQKKDGSTFSCELMIYPLLDEQDNIFAYVGHQHDISNRKKVEKTLQESEHKHRTLFETMTQGIIYQDASGQIISANPAAEHILGLTRDQLMGRTSLDPRWRSIHEDGSDFPGETHPSMITLKTGNPEKDVKMGIFDPKEEKYRWIKINSVPLFRPGENKPYQVYTTFEDITKHKKAENELLGYQQKLKSLASKLSVTEERERHRIATELHDHIGQSLVFSKLKLDELQNSTDTSELKKTLNEISNNIAQVIQDTRTLTFDLSSPILNEIGFEKAVASWLDDQIQGKHGIKTEFEDDGQLKPLDDDIRAILFRNVRELLANVAKHANAQNVKVSICKVDNQICVCVEDNGGGFDPAKVASKATFGLFSIQEQLEHLCGSLEIKSKPGHGTKITMMAPLSLVNHE